MTSKERRAGAAIVPNNGPVEGGTLVKITGEGLSSATSVQFGGANALYFHVNSDNEIEAVTPPHLYGW